MAASAFSKDSFSPGLFAGILPADYAYIYASARPKSFDRGEILFVRDEPVRQVYLITSGVVKIANHGDDGSEVILRLGVPGDVLGAAGLLASGKHDTTAQAFRSCKALLWEDRAFRPLADQFPVLHQNISRILRDDLVELGERFGELATEKVAFRLSRQLLRLIDRIGRKTNGQVEISLSREELAQMTGTTLFTVSRLLSRWEDAGILRLSRESVTVLDEKSLRGMRSACLPSNQ